MSTHLIIAHPSAQYCQGLSERFSHQDTAFSIDEVTTSEELEHKLNIEPADVIIIEQSLLKNVSFWPEGSVIVIAKKPDRDSMLAALAHRACGYFLETDEHDLLRWAVAASPGEFWLDPSIASQFIGEFSIQEWPQISGITLTSRQQEVQELKDKHLPNKEIAKKLCISEKTVKKHVEHINQKLAKKR